MNNWNDAAWANAHAELEPYTVLAYAAALLTPQGEPA